jgi:hypothetical protein
MRALHGRSQRRTLQERGDDLARVSGLRGILDPDLGQRLVERQLACHARCVRIEDVRSDALVLKRIPDEMRFRQVGGGVDPLQNLYETIAPQASCLMPERPEMFRYETLRPHCGAMSPLTPTDVVT